MKEAESLDFPRVFGFLSTFPRWFEHPTYRLGVLCDVVNPCKERYFRALYYQGLLTFSNQILTIWISFLSSSDKPCFLADSLQLLTSGFCSVVTDSDHIPATIPFTSGNDKQYSIDQIYIITIHRNELFVYGISTTKWFMFSIWLSLPAR